MSAPVSSQNAPFPSYKAPHSSSGFSAGRRRAAEWSRTWDRAEYRSRVTSDNRNYGLGFRVGRTLSAGAGAITVAPGAH
jgi:hypothetical protein